MDTDIFGSVSVWPSLDDVQLVLSVALAAGYLVLVVPWVFRQIRKASDPSPPVYAALAVYPHSRGGAGWGRVAWANAWHVCRLHANYGGPSIPEIARSLRLSGYSPGYAWTLADRAVNSYYASRPDFFPRNDLEWRVMR